MKNNHGVGSRLYALMFPIYISAYSILAGLQ